MDISPLSPNNIKIGEKLVGIEDTFGDNKEMDKDSSLLHILEKQAKEFEEFSKRMNLELQTTYNAKKRNEKTEVERGATCRECIEKSELISTLKARIEELENDSKVKSQDIEKLQNDVKSLFDIIVKRGPKTVEKTDIVSTIPTKITITTEIDGTINEVEDEDEGEEGEEEEMYYNDIKDSYSDSAIDLFTDDDASIGDGSVKSDDDDYYSKPSEWLDVSPTSRQRARTDKKNLDRWNSKMASNGLLPIRLVGKVDTERERKYQTHRKGYSTSAIWLKTYERKKKQDQKVQEEKLEKYKLPTFKFSKYTFNTAEDTKEKKSEETSISISLKSSASTSVSELTTCSLATTSLASTSLQPYEMFSKEHKNTFTSNSHRILSHCK